MSDIYYDLYCEEVEKSEALIKENKALQNDIRLIKRDLKNLEDKTVAIIEQKVQEAIEGVKAVYQKEIEIRDKKIVVLEAILKNDSKTYGLPTSKTPIHKKVHSKFKTKIR